jgi:hypothetical protein
MGHLPTSNLRQCAHHPSVSMMVSLHSNKSDDNSVMHQLTVERRGEGSKWNIPKDSTSKCSVSYHCNLVLWESVKMRMFDLTECLSLSDDKHNNKHLRFLNSLIARSNKDRYNPSPTPSKNNRKRTSNSLYNIYYVDLLSAYEVKLFKLLLRLQTTNIIEATLLCIWLILILQFIISINSCKVYFNFTASITNNIQCTYLILG